MIKSWRLVSSSLDFPWWIQSGGCNYYHFTAAEKNKKEDQSKWKCHLIQLVRMQPSVQART